MSRTNCPDDAVNMIERIGPVLNAAAVRKLPQSVACLP